MKRRRRSQAGFTLIELMVSLVLFSFAIAGVLAIAVSMAQGYREQRQVVETETTARGALDFIADALRMASPAVRNAVLKTKTVGPDVLVIDPSNTVTVEDTMGATSGPCPQGTIRLQNNTGFNGSDILDVVFASGPVVTTLKSTWDKTSLSIDVFDTSSLAAGDTLLLTNGTDGRLVRIDSITDGDTVALLAPTCTVTDPSGAGSYPAATMVVRALRARFFLDDNPTDGVDTALYMDPDGDGGLPAEPLADWIEDFQVAVGIDENTIAPSDKTIDPDEWVYSAAAGTFTADGTKKLHALRVTLVARPASRLVATTATYSKPVIEDHNPGGSPDTLRRRVLSTTVEIRNLTDSP